jgi:glycosyltransferase involved in cell wall biosynthesis
MSVDYSISVVIPAYNSGAFIANALNSVFCQTTKASEIIVIDDGSTDNTATVIASFSDVKYSYQPNRGPAAARNRGIQSALSQWIAFLDSDDTWKPYHLEKTMAIIKKYNLVWACAGYEQSQSYKWKGLLVDDCVFKDFFKAFARDAPFNSDGMVINRNILLEVGLFDADLKNFEDFDIFFRIAYKHNEIGFIWPPTIIRNIRYGSLSFSYHSNTVILLEKHQKILSYRSDRDRKKSLPAVKHLAIKVLMQSFTHSDKTALKILVKKYGYLLGIYRLKAWVGLYCSIKVAGYLDIILFGVFRFISRSIKKYLYSHPMEKFSKMQK